MKKLLLPLLLCLLLACPALAEDAPAAPWGGSVNAAVVAPETAYVTAPFQARCCPFPFHRATA